MLSFHIRMLLRINAEIACNFAVKLSTMTLQEFYSQLDHTQELSFALPNGSLVPAHFHITEVGQLDRFFLDCGGVMRKESVVNLQMYTAEDYDHRLTVPKLVGILAASALQLQLRRDAELRVEYQGATIEVYGLSHDGHQFILTALQTDCLAKDKCGIPEKKSKQTIQPACTPGSGCC